MDCWKCKKLISNEPMKIGFRTGCPHCSADLHVCLNCKYRVLGKPNECIVPGTELIRDREKANFCEEFQLKTDAHHSPSSNALNRARRLLGLEDKNT